jgi:predicted permease
VADHQAPAGQARQPVLLWILNATLAIWRIRKEYQELSDNRPCHAKSLSLQAFFLGMAKVELKINFEVVGNALVKMIGQPALMALLAANIGVANPLWREGVLICAIPTAVFAPLIAPHYKVYEAEAASTLVLTALLMIVTLPLAILLTGA